LRLSGDHHIAVVWFSSSPYTQLAVPYLTRFSLLPSVVTWLSVPVATSTTYRLRSAAL
jgi:hypothetical protein